VRGDPLPGHLDLGGSARRLTVKYLPKGGLLQRQTPDPIPDLVKRGAGASKVDETRGPDRGPHTTRATSTQRASWILQPTALHVFALGKQYGRSCPQTHCTTRTEESRED
jgi:hypothetical protein